MWPVGRLRRNLGSSSMTIWAAPGSWRSVRCLRLSLPAGETLRTRDGGAYRLLWLPRRWRNSAPDSRSVIRKEQTISIWFTAERDSTAWWGLDFGISAQRSRPQAFKSARGHRWPLLRSRTTHHPRDESRNAPPLSKKFGRPPDSSQRARLATDFASP